MRHGGSEGTQAAPGRQGLLSRVPDTAGCRHRSRIAVHGLDAGYPWGRVTAGGQDGDRSENPTLTPSLQQCLPERPASPQGQFRDSRASLCVVVLSVSLGQAWRALLCPHHSPSCRRWKASVPGATAQDAEPRAMAVLLFCSLPRRLPRVPVHGPVCIVRCTGQASGAVGQGHGADSPAGRGIL